ncbi:peptidylprolyl isomerase [Maricaulis sp.]|uniref:peptidylprolyl isomerase n=1 Tax=Maricaulis sp. TaxID=1486257 RepID=UPI003A8DE687
MMALKPVMMIRALVLGISAWGVMACSPAADDVEIDTYAFGPDEAEQAMAEVEIPDFTGIPDWRLADPEDLLLIETRRGMVTVELSDEFAPNHAARMRQAVRDGFFDGRDFYRVIDGFVAQGGRGEEADSVDLPQYPVLAGEFRRPTAGISFTAMIDADLYAPVVGHVNGFPAAQSEDGAQTWLIHCPGTVAMARDNGPDTGDVEFYIVIGQGPRHLDRIMSVFGRVIDGMEHVQALNRGDPMVNSGVIADPALRDPILSMRIVADLPEAQRPAYEIMRTDGEAFHAAKAARRNRSAAFFFETPPAVIEACHMPGRVRRVN